MIILTDDIPTLKVYEQIIYYGSMVFWGLPFVMKIIHKKAMIEMLTEQKDKEKQTPEKESTAQLLSNLYSVEEEKADKEPKVEECPSCNKLGLVVWQKRCKFCNSIVKLEPIRKR